MVVVQCVVAVAVVRAARSAVAAALLRFGLGVASSEVFSSTFNAGPSWRGVRLYYNCMWSVHRVSHQQEARMDNTSDFGKFAVHGHFVLDLDLSGRLSPDDATSLGQSVGNAFSASLAKLFKETSEFTGRREISVLCSGRVRRPDGTPALSSNSVQLSPMSQSGWHEIEGTFVDGRFYGRTEYDG